MVLYTQQIRKQGYLQIVFDSIEESMAVIKQYEETNKAECTYQLDFYDIVEEDHCSVSR